MLLFTSLIQAAQKMSKDKEELARNLQSKLQSIMSENDTLKERTEALAREKAMLSQQATAFAELNAKLEADQNKLKSERLLLEQSNSELKQNMEQIQSDLSAKVRRRRRGWLCALLDPARPTH